MVTRSSLRLRSSRTLTRSIIKINIIICNTFINNFLRPIYVSIFYCKVLLISKSLLTYPMACFRPRPFAATAHRAWGRHPLGRERSPRLLQDRLIMWPTDDVRLDCNGNKPTGRNDKRQFNQKTSTQYGHVGRAQPKSHASKLDMTH